MCRVDTVSGFGGQCIACLPRPCEKMVPKRGYAPRSHAYRAWVLLLYDMGNKNDARGGAWCSGKPARVLWRTAPIVDRIHASCKMVG